MKKYIAKTNVSINVVLTSGANRHIAFSALTGGGSVFYTDDPDIQSALERHYKYGTLFRSDPNYKPEAPGRKPVSKPKPKHEDISEVLPAVVSHNEPASEDNGVDTPTVTEHEEDNASETGAQTTDEDNEDNELKRIVVSDPDAAKAYLAEHFGISRTKIKSLKAIKEAAASNGVIFEGI